MCSKIIKQFTKLSLVYTVNSTTFNIRTTFE